MGMLSPLGNGSLMAAWQVFYAAHTRFVQPMASFCDNDGDGAAQAAHVPCEGMAQQILVSAISDDAGVNWSSPVIIAESEDQLPLWAPVPMTEVLPASSLFRLHGMGIM